MSELKIELIKPFITGTKEVFESMAEIKIRRKDLYLKEGYMMYGEISGIIGLSGTTTGTCSISMPGELAISAVGNLMGDPIKGGPDQVIVRDGVGEMINMITGRAKAILSKTKYKFNITLPTIISGQGHEFFSQRRNTPCVVIIFESDLGHFFSLEVCAASRS